LNSSILLNVFLWNPQRTATSFFANNTQFHLVHENFHNTLDFLSAVVMSDTPAAIPLSNESLASLDGRIIVPRFDRKGLPSSCGIVHLGFGGFHRAHLARYTHLLMEIHEASRSEWAILGVGLLPSDLKMREALVPQDSLYTLVERDGRGGEVARVIGSVGGVLYAGEESGRRELLHTIEDERVKIISLTVTEAGYCLNSVTKTLDFSHPLIAHDLLHPTSPKTTIGVIVESYRRRREKQRPPFTTMSCDNIQHNGHLLRAAVLAFARHIDPGLSDWIAEFGRFPNSMVDRITPVTTQENLEYLQAEYHVKDNWPVFCEAFTQFVVEDAFASNLRPQWELVGVQFVKDVTPYEMMKLRLLNGSHLAVACLGDLIGYTYIHESLQDEYIRRYMKALMDRETSLTLLPVPGIDLEQYKETLLVRFSNPSILDTVLRVATDAPLAVIIAILRDLLAQSLPIHLASFTLAAWLRRVRGGANDVGIEMTIRNPLKDLLREKAIEGGVNPGQTDTPHFQQFFMKRN
jgi:mannitol 2-dehydrogenase